VLLDATLRCRSAGCGPLAAVATARAFASWPVDDHGLLLHTFHGLRHLACVWQLRDVGIDVVTVSRSMGQASVSFPQNRCLGEAADARELAMGRLDDSWGWECRRWRRAFTPPRPPSG